MTFIQSWVGTVTIFIVLFSFSTLTEIYETFPIFGFIGYTSVILLLLHSISAAVLRWHYLLVSFTLIFAGTIATLDIVVSRDVIVDAFHQFDLMIFEEMIKDKETTEHAINTLVILLNIFSGSLAADTLFYGLNKKHFE